KATQNKQVTRNLLRRAGLPAPAGAAFRDFEAARRYFMEREVPQVVKPLLGTGGNGVTTRVTELEQFAKAWRRAAEIGRTIVVEDHVAGDELRLIVLDGEVIAAL